MNTTDFCPEAGSIIAVRLASRGCQGKPSSPSQRQTAIRPPCQPRSPLRTSKRMSPKPKTSGERAWPPAKRMEPPEGVCMVQTCSSNPASLAPRGVGSLPRRLKFVTQPGQAQDNSGHFRTVPNTLAALPDITKRKACQSFARRQRPAGRVVSACHNRAHRPRFAAHICSEAGGKTKAQTERLPHSS